MNPISHPLRRLSLGIALALAIPALALAQQDDRYQERSTDTAVDQQRDKNASDMRDDTRSRYTSTSKADTRMADTKNVSRSALADRPGQSAKDARREAVVWTSFELNDQLRNADIDVEVRNGSAVLTGTVESKVESELAEEIAQSVDGINRVDNRIRVDRAHMAATSDKDRPVAGRDGGERDFATALADATTTAKVKSKLLWNSRTDGLDIDVDTQYGQVTLTGTADTQQSRQLAERIARDTEGVSMVKNQLTISPDRDVAALDDDMDASRANQTFESDFEQPDRTGSDRDSRVLAADSDRFDPDPDSVAGVDADRDMNDRDMDDRDMEDDAVADMERPDSWITTKVKSTLLFSRTVDGFEIDVDTRDGVVMLKGSVDSAQEKQLATQLARDIQGVRQVDASQLRIDDAAVAGREEE